MSENDEKEDFSEWVICGSNGETFVGRPVPVSYPTSNSRLNEPSYDDVATGKGVAAGKVIRLFPCYRYATANVSVPQADMHGRVTGVNVQIVEMIGSPASAPCDVETEILLSWVSKYPRKPGLLVDEAVNAHIARIVKVARDNQVAARAASAGITRASGLRM